MDALASVQGCNNLCIPPQDDGSNSKTFLIDVDAAGNCLALVIELKANRWWGVKDIGEVHVPIEELLNLYGASNDLMHAHYDIPKTQAGKCKGVLNFSFKFEDIVVLALGSSVTPPPPQMQQQEKTGMRKKFVKKLGKLGRCVCGLAKIALLFGAVIDIN